MSDSVKAQRAHYSAAKQPVMQQAGLQSVLLTVQDCENLPACSPGLASTNLEMQLSCEGLCTPKPYRCTASCCKAGCTCVDLPQWASQQHKARQLLDTQLRGEAGRRRASHCPEEQAPPEAQRHRAEEQRQGCLLREQHHARLGAGVGLELVQGGCVRELGDEGARDGCRGCI